MILTFGELKIFNEILNGNFDIANFTPKKYYELTEYKSSYSYADILMFAKYVKSIRSDNKFKALLNRVVNGKNVTNESIGEINILAHAIENAHNYLITGDTKKHDFPRYLSPLDDIKTTVSKRFFKMKNAPTQSNNSASEVMIAFNSLNYAQNNLPSIMGNGLKHNYIASMYDEKVTGDFSAEKAKAVRDDKNTKNQIVANVIKYDNFFNTVMLLHELKYLHERTHTWVPNYTDDSGCTGFIKTINEDKTYTWKLLSTKTDGNQNRFSEDDPLSNLLVDTLVGNCKNYVEKLPMAFFHNDKFSHFEQDIPFTDTEKAYIDDTFWGSERVAEYLESKGFKVRTRKQISKNTVRTQYNLADLMLNSWKASDKDYKMEMIKRSAGSWMSMMTNSVEGIYHAEANKLGDNAITCCAMQILYNTAVGAFGYCNYLNTLYVAEPDLEVRAALEMAIFSVREAYKTENYKFLHLVKKVGFSEEHEKELITTAKIFLNDDLYPQGLLKSANKLDEARRSVNKFKAKTLMAHPNFTYHEKLEILNRRRDEFSAQQKNLAKFSLFKRKERADRIKLLEVQKKEFREEGFKMLDEIYTDTTVAQIRTDEGSLPVLFGRTHYTITKGRDRDENYYKRLQPKEGLHNDPYTDLFEHNMQRAYDVHKQNTGEDLVAIRQHALDNDQYDDTTRIAAMAAQQQTQAAANAVQQAAQPTPNPVQQPTQQQPVNTNAQPTQNPAQQQPVNTNIQPIPNPAQQPAQPIKKSKKVSHQTINPTT